MNMKKIIILCLVIFLLAVSLDLPESGITGFFVKVATTGLALAKEVLKTVLTFIVNLL